MNQAWLINAAYVDMAKLIYLPHRVLCARATSHEDFLDMPSIVKIQAAKARDLCAAGRRARERDAKGRGRFRADGKLFIV